MSFLETTSTWTFLNKVKEFLESIYVMLGLSLFLQNLILVINLKFIELAWILKPIFLIKLPNKNLEKQAISIFWIIMSLENPFSFTHCCYLVFVAFHLPFMGHDYHASNWSYWLNYLRAVSVGILPCYLVPVWIQ